MKKLVVLALLLAAVTGFAAAGGLVFQLGAGYHSSYYSDSLTWPSTDPSSYPLGVGGYAGLGYGFGEKKMFSVGAEFAPSWTVGFSPEISFNNFAYQIRGFVKFKPAGLLTITGFGGYAGTSLDLDAIPEITSNNMAFGARITVLFLYAEYAAVVPPDFSTIARNEIGLGFAIFK